MTQGDKDVIDIFAALKLADGMGRLHEMAVHIRQLTDKWELAEWTKGPKVANANEALRTLFEKADGAAGQITLDEFCEMTTATRMDCIGALRNEVNGTFVTGRRGRKSTFFFGLMHKERAAKMNWGTS